MNANGALFYGWTYNTNANIFTTIAGEHYAHSLFLLLPGGRGACAALILYFCCLFTAVYAPYYSFSFNIEE